MAKIIAKLMFAATAVTAALSFDIPVSHASVGDAPWCVVKTGDDIFWDCQYRTGQACLQALAAGDRGTCNVNPAPAAAAQPASRKRRSP